MDERGSIEAQGLVAEALEDREHDLDQGLVPAPLTDYLHVAAAAALHQAPP